jgi:hypothetical protein
MRSSEASIDFQRLTWRSISYDENRQEISVVTAFRVIHTGLKLHPEDGANIFFRNIL